MATATTTNTAASSAAETKSRNELDDELAAVVKLREVFDKTLEKILQAFTFEQFMDCFPTLCSSRNDAAELLHPLYVTVLNRFVENARVRAPSSSNTRARATRFQPPLCFARRRGARSPQEEFKLICAERKVIEKLHELDDTIIVQQTVGEGA